MQRGSATIDRVNEILNAPLIVEDKKDAIKLQNLNIKLNLKMLVLVLEV